MKNKVIFILCLFCIFIISFFMMSKERPKEENGFYMENIESETLESLLMTNFEENENITIGQVLVFYNRVIGNNVKNFDDVKMYCKDKEIFLPSDLVYNMEDWENLWRDIVLGNTVFEKVNDDTFSITLIQGYLKIYLNKHGYELIKQGLIPPHLYLYSPFSSIEDLESINFNKNATLGFILELFMNIEYKGENRKGLLHDLVVDKVEELTSINEKNWTSSEVALYNYYSLSYFGEFCYFKEKNCLENIELNDLTSEITVSDFLVLVEKLIQKDS